MTIEDQYQSKMHNLPNESSGNTFIYEFVKYLLCGNSVLWTFQGA